MQITIITNRFNIHHMPFVFISMEHTICVFVFAENVLTEHRAPNIYDADDDVDEANGQTYSKVLKCSLNLL